VKYLIATCQFHHAGGRVDKGESYPDDDPVVKAFPDCFITPDEWAASQARQRITFGPGTVEQATAGPGEKRPTRRPGK
jgi:hypothetical protein